MADEREIEEAFERGRQVGQREGLAFKGTQPVRPWCHGVRFRFKTSWFDSFVAYERELLEDLRRVQCGRWLDHRDGREDDLGTLHKEIEDELAAARDAVDAELREERGNPRIVEAMRASPQLPDHVVEFADLESFVAADRRRGVFDWPHRRDAGGADFGHRWRLEDCFRRWQTTRWRVSWLCERKDPTGEVYAIEFLDGPSPRDGYQFGRVWLLGELHGWDNAMRALGDLQLDVQNERNSLIVVAGAVRAAMEAFQG